METYFDQLILRLAPDEPSRRHPPAPAERPGDR
jgi:hypothetical protein